MAHLALSQVDLARESKVSVFTIRRLQSGEPWNYREANLRKLSLALGWPNDAIERLLKGDPPPTVVKLQPAELTVEATPLHPSTSPARVAPVAELQHHVANLTERVERVERMLAKMLTKEDLGLAAEGDQVAARTGGRQRPRPSPSPGLDD